MHPFLIWWCRRDIRLEDNTALNEALNTGIPVQPVFIFDTNILNDLRNNTTTLTLDRRVEFIYNEVVKLNSILQKKASSLWIYHGDPLEIWQQIILKHKGDLQGVYINRDYEPYANSRDKKIGDLISDAGISLNTCKDQCIFQFDEILKEDGNPYTIFTPYSRKWKEHFNMEMFCEQAVMPKVNFRINSHTKIPDITLVDIGFLHSKIAIPANTVKDELIAHYDKTRDFPAMRGTSRLGVHLRFGTISIRKLVRQAIDAGGDMFLNELIWREFYMMILAHFPRVIDHSFRPKYDNIKWRNSPEEFSRWCNGQTGYPIVDAGMRELNNTGYMHNRVRMITASFLTKHLLIDWRWGEAYFAKQLLDYELSSNNGGWQWAAGTGCDAAPYFRVFNPYLQTQKFDPALKYIRHWVPEVDSSDYSKPIVEHAFARKRALEAYGKALKSQ